VFDISSYAAPVIQYYRWFSNDQGANFKNDPWIVKIKDASGSSWQTVEQTYQSDVKWRCRIFPVSKYLPSLPAQIQMRFFISDSVLTNWDTNGQSTTVAGLDDFTIYDNMDHTSVENVSLPKAEIYPNPTDETLFIKLSAGTTGTISMYDMNGRKMNETSMESGKTEYTLDTKYLAASAYFVVIQGDKNIQSRKIIVTHN
jgi:hypothetical protein